MDFMTQAELDALPEDGTMSVRDEMRDGRMVRVPYLNSVGALFHPDNPDEPISVTDASGQRWLLGYANGVRYKRKLR
jgi:hypothetical protein